MTVEDLSFSVLRATVRHILDRAASFQWSLQGLGMLRLYLSPEYRLHIWDSRYCTADGSTIHTHPWSFDSLVISGQIRQQRFTEDSVGLRTFRRQLIQCGPGGCAVGDPEIVNLITHPEERYGAGEAYHQEANEIHESTPLNGTVTIVRRKFLLDTEHAYVYFTGDKWTSAEPRPATEVEVSAIVGLALERW